VGDVDRGLLAAGVGGMAADLPARLGRARQAVDPSLAGSGKELYRFPCHQASRVRLLGAARPLASGLVPRSAASARPEDAAPRPGRRGCRSRRRADHRRRGTSRRRRRSARATQQSARRGRRSARGSRWSARAPRSTARASQRSARGSQRSSRRSRRSARGSRRSARALKGANAGLGTRAAPSNWRSP
jgi:hypothetical protein